MATLFSSLVRPSKVRRSSSPRHSSEERSAGPIKNNSVDEPRLRDLNVSLQALSDIFPDIQPEVFREMLLTFSEESRVQVITETLLKHGHKYVRGRFRTPAEEEEQLETAQLYRYRRKEASKDTRGMPLALVDTFRSQQYRDVAREALYKEFQGLSHSTIKAVLAEYNWSYTQARPTLLGLSSKSWRSSITNFLMRRKGPSAKDHPLVVWTTSNQETNRPRIPLLVTTRSYELNQELYESLIAPELEKQQAQQVHADFELALRYNEEEAEAQDEMYDCEVCFIPNTLQQMSTCDIAGHYICFRCIRYAINAALYDQGWARNIDSRLCTMKCIAPMPGGQEDCCGCVPLEYIRRALLEERSGEDNVAKLHERFTNEALNKSQLPLIRCPFCSYAEFDQLAFPDADLFINLQFKPMSILVASLTSMLILELMCYNIVQIVVLPIIILYTFAAFLFNLPILAPVRSALYRIHVKRRGLRFQCQSPTCGRASCLSCNLPWHDPHTCFSSQLTSLRLTIERATTDAVKRTCPQCNLGFVKSGGCNKLVCLCGYSMCYICRQGLAGEGYRHFCSHFREQPGQSCNECTRCDLYRVEDEEIVMKRAKEAAEQAWWQKQGDCAKEGLEKEVKRENNSSCAKKRSWEGWIEDLLESVLI